MASATRAFSPPDNMPIFRWDMSPIRPRAPIALRASWLEISELYSRTQLRTWSMATSSMGRSWARSWVKIPSFTPCPSTLLPSRRSSLPLRARRKVDLPAPLGPTTTRRDPRSSTRSQSLSMVLPFQPKRAFFSTRGSAAQGGGLGRRNTGSLREALPASRASSGASSLSIFSRAFTLDWAAEALVALAPKVRMNFSMCSISLCCASYAFLACSARSRRRERKAWCSPR
mmetsp:Transcript_23118/g.33596  ORF Transcript_23118/g.33596 Transcript_23118/m.33596 type:complete len:229 (-) Transcript_23118:1027-1713(-)